MAAAVFMLDGHDLAVYPTIAAAEASSEVHDLASATFFSEDGTVLRATAEGYRVRLTPTTERRPEELRERVRSYLQQPTVGLDPGLAEDPPRAAQALMQFEWTTGRLKRFPWLDRRINGTKPAHLGSPGDA